MILVIVFTLQDEFGRTFGGDFELEVKCIDLDIVEMKNPSPEKKPPVVVKPHKADTEYKNELVTLKEMGVDLTNKVKDLVVKCKGRLDEVFEQI